MAGLIPNSEYSRKALVVASEDGPFQKAGKRKAGSSVALRAPAGTTGKPDHATHSCRDRKARSRYAILLGRQEDPDRAKRSRGATRDHSATRDQYSEFGMRPPGKDLHGLASSRLSAKLVYRRQYARRIALDRSPQRNAHEQDHAVEDHHRDDLLTRRSRTRRQRPNQRLHSWRIGKQQVARPIPRGVRSFHSARVDSLHVVPLMSS